MSLLRRAEWAALIYLIALSTGALAAVGTLLPFAGPGQDPLDPLMWPLAYLGFAALFALYYRRFTAACLHNWIMLAWPLLAWISLIWSISPMDTANAALRMTVSTLMAVYIGLRFELAQVLAVVFVVLLLAVGVSLAVYFADLPFAIDHEGNARGIFYHKNVLGNRAGLLALTAWTLWLAGYHRRWVCVAACALALVAVVVADSATAIIATGVAALAAYPLLVLRREDAGLVGHLAFMAWVATLGLLVVVALRVDLVAGLLDALGRNTTLTGRSKLWDLALYYIGERPVLGGGFEAIWPAGLDWRSLYVLERLGYVGDFHNTFLDVATQLGLVGIALALAILGCYAVAAMRGLRRGPDATAIWPASYLLLLTTLGMAEHVLFSHHNLFHTLLVATFVMLRRPGSLGVDALAPAAGDHPALGYHGAPFAGVRKDAA